MKATMSGSTLSAEMLNNLNPSFILELTATPRSTSNIISYVDARELKKENMVKTACCCIQQKQQTGGYSGRNSASR